METSYRDKSMIAQQRQLKEWVAVLGDMIDHPDMEKVREFAESDSWIKVNVAYRRMKILMATEI